MFIGEYTYLLDDKKRLAVPARFRNLLGKKVVITRGLDHCLFIFSTKEWQSLAEKISKLPLSQSDARGFSRLMLGGAMEVSIDSLGRILIPDYLKKYSLLKKKAVLVGVMNRIEVWDEFVWEKYKGMTEKEGENIAERLKELGI
ncbi:MAG: division/cell wall cluster transcriptional repressor MraZ [Candidatus Pacebacteria bacterium]|nr:division/cell wall cluster transcriptional repressor MraZ [Candidatus Paceibacterota bacterium]